ncbi:MAG: toluene monooxygenase, partial [Gammaproteobacteria bacterium]
YWDYFLKDIDMFHHGMQLGLWTYRQTAWFNVPAGVSKDEREWLEGKYPGWNDTWGRQWDVITDNILRGKPEDTLFKTMPLVCSMSQLPLIHVAGERWDPTQHMLKYQGRNYYFQSAVDRWVFLTDPERYKDHLNVADMAARGMIQPMTPDGALNFMGLSAAERGGDSGNYAWAESFRPPRRKAS